MNKNITIEILKSNYSIENPNPDDNIRFILGKCNSFIGCVYATKLKVEFNCKGIATEEKDSTLKNIRLYYGNDVCNESRTIFVFIKISFLIEFEYKNLCLFILLLLFVFIEDLVLFDGLLCLLLFSFSFFK